MQAIAIQAVHKLALELLEYGDFQANWHHIDKIERRFRITGTASRYIQAFRDQSSRAQLARLRSIWANNDNAFHLMASPYL